MSLDMDKTREIIKLAFREDFGQGDLATNLLVSPDRRARAAIVAQQAGVIAGLAVAEEVFRLAGVENGAGRDELRFECGVKDAENIKKGQVLCEISGFARALLSGERTALNFLQRLSGIATLTRRYVTEVEKISSKTKVYDTRKTSPGMRYLEKYAVRCGGGFNHRMGLWDMVLVKDNHLIMAESRERLSGIRKKLSDGMKIEVEVNTTEELEWALGRDVDIVMLDNMDIKTLRKAVKLIGGKCSVEVSGGVGLHNIAEVAKLGVDRISIGALTHSSEAIDMTMEFKNDARYT